MTYSHGLWKDKEEDAGPPICFLLLSEQELGRCECDAALSTALFSQQRGCVGNPQLPSHTQDGHSTPSAQTHSYH